MHTLAEPPHRRKHLPAPPLIIYFFAALFSTICTPLSIAYGWQISVAPTYAYINNTWPSTGSGLLYYLPAPLTLALAITSTCLYHRRSIPILYSLVTACTLFAGWIVVLVFWTQCHSDLYGSFMDEDTFCYQRSLRAGRRKQTYRGVGDSLAYAGMAFGALLVVVFGVEIIGTGLELRKGRRVGVWRYAVAAKRAGNTGGKGEGRGGGYAVDGAVDGGFWAIDAGGGGGGDGGGGGGGDGGGGGGGDGGGC
ncbi:hypothetical protein P171DRAFT_482072 [Karstenula rhodostoma CBS 690.94]|uniref:Uncharacterized protein n=1 Tax=Karstenula rhodostoma CBS 690.94 TaxID=1392251 RepID=A0A9P4PTF6_9PLEO|nr:hypothetical protein P171DRAFT_482072 [Karstenula rhodostoma CBS 690.94]